MNDNKDTGFFRALSTIKPKNSKEDSLLSIKESAIGMTVEFLWITLLLVFLSLLSLAMFLVFR